MFAMRTSSIIDPALDHGPDIHLHPTAPLLHLGIDPRRRARRARRQRGGRLVRRRCSGLRRRDEI